MSAYIDTSFLASLYLFDANSNEAVGTMTRVNAGGYLASTLTLLEAVNAFYLRAFRKEISTIQAKRCSLDLDKDLHGGVFQVVAVADSHFERAQQISRRLTARMGTRTADLLHVAIALEVGAAFLYSFDVRQRELAKALGMKVNRVHM